MVRRLYERRNNQDWRRPLKTYSTIEWKDGVVKMLDQRRLPEETVYIEYRDPVGVAGAIKDMVIRGAPAIGAAAAFGLALAAANSQAESVAELRAEIGQAVRVLHAARPTAVNLAWALTRMQERLEGLEAVSVEAWQAAAVEEALEIAREDVETNRRMGLNGLGLVPDKARIIHHCNTGALATVDYGTALGVIRTAHEHGKQVHVYVDETRPRLQGARLTTWELLQLGVPHTVVVDGASGYLMSRVGIDLCIVGCDRMAANGDTANKIGTFNLALAAHAHQVPFYVALPLSTIDFSLSSGQEIPIEERPAEEVTKIGDCPITPEGAQAANPAFDVTPARYITAIITECGVAYPPFEESLAALAKSKGSTGVL
jgi:methylthioribose-1-phosphate isomerase